MYGYFIQSIFFIILETIGNVHTCVTIGQSKRGLVKRLLKIVQGYCVCIYSLSWVGFTIVDMYCVYIVVYEVMKCVHNVTKRLLV